ncbi:MAG: two pore domain potassium channel family protein [Gammaproteobacteria bacterium]|nr:MAG: two pore domain potassium channel family protein [Gammaproteobacteria bacterium]
MKKKISEKDNFTYLLVSLIFLLFSSACVDEFMSDSGLGQYFVIALTLISMSIAVWSIRSSRYAFNTGLGLVVGIIVITLIVGVLDMAQLEFIHLLLMLVFFLITLKLASEQALFSGAITANSIIGSICIFLLLGLIWVMLYLLVAEFIPDAFSGIEPAPWKQNFPDFIYFSFVTLTTLGFGDLLPLSPLARFLVYMEAVVGVFYMAIVVSSLVGAALSDSETDKKS